MKIKYLVILKNTKISIFLCLSNLITNSFVFRLEKLYNIYICIMYTLLLSCRK